MQFEYLVFLSKFLEFKHYFLVFGAEDCEGRPPTHSEMKQLFLPYRGFCARKGVTNTTFFMSLYNLYHSRFFIS